MHWKDSLLKIVELIEGKFFLIFFLGLFFYRLSYKLSLKFNSDLKIRTQIFMNKYSEIYFTYTFKYNYIPIIKTKTFIISISKTDKFL